MRLCWSVVRSNETGTIKRGGAGDERISLDRGYTTQQAQHRQEVMSCGFPRSRGRMEKSGYGGEEKLQNSTGRQIGFVVDRDRHQLTHRCSKLGLELGLLGGCWLLAPALVLRSCCPATKYAMSINRRAGGGSRPLLRATTPTTAKPHLMVLLQGTRPPPAHFVV